MAINDLPVSRREFEGLRKEVYGNGAPGITGNIRDVKRVICEMQESLEKEARENKNLRDEWNGLKNQLRGAKFVLWVIAGIISIAGTVGAATLGNLLKEILSKLP